MLQTQNPTPGFVMITTCPVCGRGDLEETHEERFEVATNLEKYAQGAAKLLWCNTCSFGVTDRTPDDPGFFTDLYDIRNAREHLTATTTSSVKRLINRQARKLILKHKSGGRLLDVGCGTGDFLKSMTDRFQCEGVEISTSAGKYCLESGIKVHARDFSQIELNENSFDVITFIDALEHMRDPRKQLLLARKLLRPDGLIYIKVPNGPMQLLKQTIRSKLFGTNVGILYDYSHLNHFTMFALRKLTQSVGFETLEYQFGNPVLGRFPNPIKFKREAISHIFYRLSTEMLNRTASLTKQNWGLNLVLLAKKI